MAIYGGVDLLKAAQTTAEFGLGDTGAQKEGQEGVYVEADEAIAAGDVCVIQDDFGVALADNTSTAPAAGQGAMAGVAAVAMASGEFGWLLRCGQFTVPDLAAATGAVAYTILNGTATGGTVDDDATTGAEEIIGIVLTTTESSGVAPFSLNYPYVGLTIPA